MAEILGLGITHYPRLTGLDESMANTLRWTLQDKGIPDREKDPANWPAPMRAEYGTDGGTAAAAAHRKALVANFDRAMNALDEFKPDVVIIWGDDQYENFKEDCIPPFCVLAYGDTTIQPWEPGPRSDRRGPNAWGETEDKTFTIPGHPQAAKYLASNLLNSGFDVSYSYKALHNPGLPHAFLNSILFLDYHRKGFPYPMVGFSVNCYGRRVISQRGGMASFEKKTSEFDLDPPSPTPDRCFDLGAATAKVMLESPYRTALIASSSWSHAFLCDKTWRLYPDHASDHRYFEALRSADYSKWRSVSLASIEEAGQQEMLNWFCLVGAMSALNRTPDWCEFIETHLFNSNKCFAGFCPQK